MLGREGEGLKSPFSPVAALVTGRRQVQTGLVPLITPPQTVLTCNIELKTTGETTESWPAQSEG